MRLETGNRRTKEVKQRTSKEEADPTPENIDNEIKCKWLIKVD